MVRLTVIVPLSASTSAHFKPQISPMRSPVVRLMYMPRLRNVKFCLMKFRIFLWCATVSTSISLPPSVVGYFMSHSQ